MFMNRTSLFPFLAALLLALTATTGARAQTVQLEYWFDRYGGVQQLSVPAGSVANRFIDVKSLTIGLHTIYMRVRQGTDYSPITSATFIKFSSLGPSKIECWLDNDRDNIITKEFDDESEEPQVFTPNLSDIKKYPLGIHQLNMRVAAHGGHYSPIYSSYIIILPAGTDDSVVEYWFDDDYKNRATHTVDMAAEGVQKLDLDLTDLTKFPLGFHRLNMRIAENGNRYSTIYTANVMRIPAGPATFLQYWLDDDYKHPSRSWASASNGVLSAFTKGLDLSDATMGMHRLHIRAATKDMALGPVYEVPVLVTRRYNAVDIVYMSEQGTWLDDDAPLNSILSKERVKTMTYTLDATDYNDGQHAFHVQYKNTAEVWSEQNVTYFYKEPATGRLMQGFMPEEESTGIIDTDAAEWFTCHVSDGLLRIECQSQRLADRALIIVTDMSGRIVASQNVDVDAGVVHANVAVNAAPHQLLIVRLQSGDKRFTQKLHY